MWLLTLAWLGFLLPLVWPVDVKLLAMKPADFGTFVGGAFSPLAFAWLVYGYGMQRTELALQRKALGLQVEELKGLVAAARAQADAAERQAYILELQHHTSAENAERAARPRVELVYWGGHSHGLGFITRLKLVNRGERLTELRARIDGAGWKHQNPTNSAVSVETDGELMIECYTEGDYQRSPLTVHLEFEGDDGRKWSTVQTFVGSQTSRPALIQRKD